MLGRASKILLIDSNVYFAKKLSDALKREGFKGRNVAWYQRLTMYCSGMKEWPC